MAAALPKKPKPVLPVRSAQPGPDFQAPVLRIAHAIYRKPIAVFGRFYIIQGQGRHGAACPVKDLLMAQKTVSMTFMVEPELRKAFVDLCRADDLPASQVLRSFMRDYLAKKSQGRLPLKNGGGNGA